MTQNETILRHLKRFKTITTLQAIQMGITRLSGRIYDLKGMGHKIGGVTVRVKTRYGEANVKRYYLVEGCKNG